MFEAILLGAVQGIAEWLPISSEAMIILVKNNFFNDGSSLIDQVHYAIFLHLGTLLAVVIYLRKDLWNLVQQSVRYPQLAQNQKKYLSFLAITTVISGVVGYLLLQLIEQHQELFAHTTAINIFVAVLLMVTALLLYHNERQTKQNRTNPRLKDSIITGIFQGFAAVPGISRSGSTIAAMGLCSFEKKWVLTTSFILSVPLVFFANIVLNAQVLLSPTWLDMVGLLSAAVFGYLTISALLAIVNRIRFSYFVAVFAVLVVVVTIIS
jgi:undecaprenyl-diphosphatase